MEFRIPLVPDTLPRRIALRDAVLLSGSCFTEHMAARLRQYRLRVLENPNGTLFNPVSIAVALRRAVRNQPYAPEDIFDARGLWSNWEFHTRFSDPDPESALQRMNASVRDGAAFIRGADWLLLTLGSAYVYTLPDGRIVANCHKEPAARFGRRLLSAGEAHEALAEAVGEARAVNPGLRVILTVSPVRHLRDGFVGNNRSKAVLIQAAHALAEGLPDTYYFPAYELVVDDLRDYRFYAEDMVHPNYQATAYVWERFATAAIDPQAREAMREMDSLRAAMAHRPLHPGSEEHARFMKRHLGIAVELAARFPGADFSEEIRYFSGRG